MTTTLEIDADSTPGMTRCQCARWSGGSQCHGATSIADPVIEFVPEADRASHTAAGNRGSWPHNGAERIRVTPECAEMILDSDSEWSDLVES